MQRVHTLLLNAHKGLGYGFVTLTLNSYGFLVPLQYYAKIDAQGYNHHRIEQLYQGMVQKLVNTFTPSAAGSVT